MKQDRFPLVSDDEVMLTKCQSWTHDESNFISNIKIDYRDKNWLDGLPINEEETVVSPVVNKESSRGSQNLKVEKTYAELARERRVRILRRNVQPSIWLRMLVIPDDTMVQHLFVKETNQQHHFKEILVSLPNLVKAGQSHYILAEGLAKWWINSKNPNGKAKRTTMIFLKKRVKSIIKRISKQKERQVAQRVESAKLLSRGNNQKHIILLESGIGMSALAAMLHQIRT